MIFHQFPDLTWLKRQADSGFVNRKDALGRPLADPGWPNVVLNVKTQNTYRDNIRGPISIFSNVSGKSTVEVHGKRAVVNEGFFFVTNHSQHYTLQVDNSNTETLNIHFGEHFADRVLASMDKNFGKFIDHEKPLSRLEHVELYNKLHYTEPVIQDLFHALKNSEGNKLREEELLVDLVVQLLILDGRLKESECLIPVVKNSTRGEIQKRLNSATDYIYSSLNENISLDDVAAAACLSKFHFLRLFKSVYNQTPHQFITTIRIERAKSLLRNKSNGVNSIAKALGFDSSSSFSRAFYNQVRVYPSQFRAGA